MTISKFSHFLNIFDILLEQEIFVNRYFVENVPAVEVIQDELNQDEDDVKQKLAAQHPNQAIITDDDNTGDYNMNNGSTGEIQQKELNLAIFNRVGALNQPSHLRHTILPLLFM